MVPESSIGKGFKDRVPKDCNYDLEKLYDYLGAAIEMVVYSNSFSFQ